MADYEYTATPTLTNGTVSWNLCVVKPKSQAACGTSPNYPSVTVPSNNANQTFKFAISNDTTGLNIQFAPSPPPSTNVGPVWVQAGSKPTSPVLNAQIKDSKGNGNNNTELTFTDKNDNTGTLVLNYQLNFVAPNGSAVAPIDPDITNGGKTLAHPAPFNTVALLIAVAVVLVIVVAVFMRMRSQH